MSAIYQIVHFRNERLKRLLAFSFMLLIIAHGALTTLIPFLAFNISVVALIGLILFIRFKKTRNYFETITILYIVSHFSALGSKGGLAPILSFVLATLIFMNKIPFSESNVLRKSSVFWLSVALLGINFLGWVFKPSMPMIETILGAIAYLGYLFAFWISSSLRLDISRLGFFIKVMIIMVVHQGLIALNTYLGLIKTGFVIFFPATSRFGSRFTEGAFNHSELFGEFNLLSFTIFFSFLFAKKLYFNISNKWIVTGILFSTINVFLSGSRSIFGLLIVSTFLVLMGNMYLGKKMLSIKRVIKYSFLLVLFLALIWKPLNLGYVLDRFDKENSGADQFRTEELSFESIITGKGTPREGAFKYFFRTYANESNVWLGHGFGTLGYNRKAWFGSQNTTRADFHSLYLSLIISYGWIGTIIYLMIIVLTTRRLLKYLRLVYISNVYIKQYFYPMLGFFLVFLLLLINQYKISLLRIPAYHMLTWIWLGVANAIIETVKKELNESSLVSAIPGG